MQNLKYIFVGILSLLLINSCEVKNPTEGLEVRIQTISRTTGINVRLLDGATGTPIEQNVKVTFTGSNKTSVITSSNEPIAELTTKAGIAVFALEDEIVPSIANPILLTLVVASDGYSETARQIKIIKDGISNFSVSLTQINNPPSGVSSNSDNTGQTSGDSGTTNEAVVSTSSSSGGNDNDSGGEAAVTIPAGTVLQDANGTSLSGTVETSVVYTNTTNSEALSTLPGGANVGTSGAPVSGQYIPAGAVSISMNVGGQNVSQVGGGGINLSMSIPEDAINPVTSRSYQQGDKIGVWVFNPQSSVWEWIKDLIIDDSDVFNKKLGQYFTFDSPIVVDLSIISPGVYSFGNVSEGVSSCTKQIQLESTSGVSGVVYLDVVGENDNLAAVAANFVVNFSGVALKHGDSFSIEAPDDLPSINILVYDKPLTDATKQQIGSKSIGNFCSESETIIVNYTPLVTAESLPINVTVKCESTSDNPKVISPDGFSLWSREVTSAGVAIGIWEFAGSFSGGQITASLVVGKYYEFKSEYDGNFYYSLDYIDSLEAKADGISYDIVDDNRICDNF